ncbi:hypothetical protein JHN55_25205 [Streptomyces sp. MBT56]|uniref:hypothetical protein n=1 Tax=unclassified Streptomyces TaxID=2593676 RepID=UPI00190B2510|nr:MULTISPECIES: hypothetical protein [unclassified Streptomyces]MBK3559763.1 hypothetical protein [Streptomyces sp. MBT56]MBK3601295.1 hypothetical protein [Streptomyces sp. MBT54]MBK3615258.1 hypothetical protein [Streptomyces sp. MBT98]
MENKKRLQLVLMASLLTGAIIILFRDLSFPSVSLDGTILNFAIGLGAIIATNFIAAVPAYGLLKIRHAPNASAVSILAVLESFWLGYAFTPIAFSLGGSTAWDVTTVLIVFASYAASDFILNTWNIGKSRKIGVAVALVFITMLFSLFLPRF